MKPSLIRISLIALVAVMVCRAGANSTESSVVIPQEVSEIRTKQPADSMKTEEGVKKLSQLQKQYRENIVTKRTTVARGKKVVRRKVVQLAE